MKVIDLLNKIANEDEIPEKIKYENIIWCFNKINKTYYMNNTEIELFYIEKLIKRLNDEVEIIEDKENKRIEKLDLSDWWEITSSEDCKPEMLAKIFNKNALVFSSKINEIIDKINGE